MVSPFRIATTRFFAGSATDQSSVSTGRKSSSRAKRSKPKVTVDMAGEVRSIRVTSNEVAAKVACSFGHRSRQRRAFPNQKTDAADRPLESPYWGKATSGGADTPEKGSMKRRHLFDSHNQDVM